MPLSLLSRRQFPRQRALAAVGGVAVDGAAFDGAVEGRAEFARLLGGRLFVFGREGGARLAREGFELVEGAAVARGAHLRLAGAFGGGFDVGHKFGVFPLVPGGRIELPTKGL
jgi:hypothetical protein